MDVEPYFEILGHKVEDRVTGLKGVAESISFDLYGCVQVHVRTAFNEKDPAKGEFCGWVDHKRLIKKSSKPVMEPPEHTFGEETGPAQLSRR